jgi:spore coat protein U-like protein
MKTDRRGAAIALTILIGLSSGTGELFARPSNNIVNLANPATETSSSLALAYSPTSLAQASGTVTVNNGTKNADNSQYCVVFTLTNPGQQGGMSLHLSNSATGSELSLSGSPSSQGQVISGAFAAGTSANTNQVFTIVFKLDPSSMPPPGTYSAVINENLYKGSTYPPSGSPVDSNLLTVTITVGSYYDVSIVPTGSAFSLTSTSISLGFGALAAGLKLGADILVRTNVSYSLSLASAHHGSLANAADPASSIGYSLSANATRCQLNPGPGLVASGAAATYAVAARYSIIVEILSISGNPSAGSYADTVTVTLSAP